MSDKKRIYLSGYAKRKLKKESEDAVSKLPKLTNFLTIKSANGVETNKNNKNDLVLNNSYIHVENMNNDSNDSNSVMPNTIVTSKYDSLNFSENNINSCSTIESSKSDTFNFSENNIDNGSTAENAVTAINFNSNDHTIELDIELYQDPGMWPLVLNNTFIELCCLKGPEFFQNMDPKKFQSSEKKFKNFNRSLNLSLFELKLPNSEIHLRKWLMFSEHTGNVYCFVCKLFNKSNNSSFINPGFNNWKKSHEKVKEHENSAMHRKSMLTWLDRVNTKNRIDKTMAEQMLSEKKYWVEVLRRVVSVVKFLAVRGLAFEGNDSRLGSSSNGNFLGILEVISEFDPFLKQHMNERANKGSGNVSYISMRICNEIIDLMGNEVLLEIIKQLQETKYFGLILDSTPDRAHKDQFAVVVRYCYKGLVVERFLTYIHILSHTGISMAEEVIHFLENNNINLQHCRGQSYDNANNMTGIYEGLQAQIKKKMQCCFICTLFCSFPEFSRDTYSEMLFRSNKFFWYCSKTVCIFCGLNP